MSRLRVAYHFNLISLIDLIDLVRAGNDRTQVALNGDR